MGQREMGEGVRKWAKRRIDLLTVEYNAFNLAINAFSFMSHQQQVTLGFIATTRCIQMLLGNEEIAIVGVGSYKDDKVLYY
jgi:hypothetical protein